MQFSTFDAQCTPLVGCHVCTTRLERKRCTQAASVEQHTAGVRTRTHASVPAVMVAFQSALGTPFNPKGL